MRFCSLASAPVLSVIIPAYNEAQTIGRLLQQVVRAIPEVPKQVVIVDDYSKDGTSEWLRRNLAQRTASGEPLRSTMRAS